MKQILVKIDPLYWFLLQICSDSDSASSVLHFVFSYRIQDARTNRKIPGHSSAVSIVFPLRFTRMAHRCDVEWISRDGTGPSNYGY